MSAARAPPEASVHTSKMGTLRKGKLKLEAFGNRLTKMRGSHAGVGGTSASGGGSGAGSLTSSSGDAGVESLVDAKSAEFKVIKDHLKSLLALESSFVRALDASLAARVGVAQRIGAVSRSESFLSEDTPFALCLAAYARLLETIADVHEQYFQRPATSGGNANANDEDDGDEDDEHVKSATNKNSDSISSRTAASMNTFIDMVRALKQSRKRVDKANADLSAATRTSQQAQQKGKLPISKLIALEKARLRARQQMDEAQADFDAEVLALEACCDTTLLDAMADYVLAEMDAFGQCYVELDSASTLLADVRAMCSQARHAFSADQKERRAHADDAHRRDVDADFEDLLQCLARRNGAILHAVPPNVQAGDGNASISSIDFVESVERSVAHFNMPMPAALKALRKRCEQAGSVRRGTSEIAHGKALPPIPGGAAKAKSVPVRPRDVHSDMRACLRFLRTQLTPILDALAIADNVEQCQTLCVHVATLEAQVKASPT